MTDRLISGLEAMLAEPGEEGETLGAEGRELLAHRLAAALERPSPQGESAADEAEVLAAHLDGGLSGAKRQDVLEELSSSPAGLAELASAAALLQDVSGHKRQPPAALVQRAQALLLEGAAPPRRRAEPWWRPTRLAAPRMQVGLGLSFAVVIGVLATTGAPGLLTAPQPPASGLADMHGGGEDARPAPPPSSAGPPSATAAPDALQPRSADRSQVDPDADRETSYGAASAPEPGVYDSAGQPAPSAASPAPKWAAIAFSTSTRQFGVAGGGASREDAERAALATCRSHGAADCAVSISRAGQCVSILGRRQGSSATVPVSADRATFDREQSRALSICSGLAAGGACQVIASACAEDH